MKYSIATFPRPAAAPPKYAPLPAFDALADLNERQRAAASLPGGHALVLSGAGTGKTRTLTHRIAHLIHHYRVAPARILAVTFTNKAAAEMKERVVSLLARAAAGANNGSEPSVLTFHSFCARFLRRHITALSVAGLDRNFSIYDEADTERVLKALLKEARLEAPEWKARAVADLISQAKNQGLSAAAYALGETSERAATIARLYQQ